jgi:hypothetical protein
MYYKSCIAPVCEYAAQAEPKPGWKGIHFATYKSFLQTVPISLLYKCSCTIVKIREHTAQTELLTWSKKWHAARYISFYKLHLSHGCANIAVLSSKYERTLHRALTSSKNEFMSLGINLFTNCTCLLAVQM